VRAKGNKFERKSHLPKDYIDREKKKKKRVKKEQASPPVRD